MCGLLEVSKQTCTLQSAKCQLIKTMPAVLFVRILCIMEIPPQQRTLNVIPLPSVLTSMAMEHQLSKHIIYRYLCIQCIYIHSGWCSIVGTMLICPKVRIKDMLSGVAWLHVQISIMCYCGPSLSDPKIRKKNGLVMTSKKNGLVMTSYQDSPSTSFSNLQQPASLNLLKPPSTSLNFTHRPQLSTAPRKLPLEKRSRWQKSISCTRVALVFLPVAATEASNSVTELGNLW